MPTQDAKSNPIEEALPREATALLRRLGERVRRARAQRGISRKALATDSGVSERYLAQLESGQGNISVLLLQQIATALNVPIAELVSEEAAAPAELALIVQFLKRLTPQALSKVRSQLLHEHGRASAERMRHIALIGLRGAGKSSLGKRLADELDCAFVELDAEIEREAGTSLAEIFLLYGQAGYRRYERRCLERILQAHPRCVIAAGGSIVADAANYDLLLSSCFTVWLKALPEEHMARVVAQGDMRPMAGNVEAMDDLRRILEGRNALYAQADVTIDTAGRSIDQSFSALAAAIAGNNERHEGDAP